MEVSFWLNFAIVGVVAVIIFAFAGFWIGLMIVAEPRKGHRHDRLLGSVLMAVSTLVFCLGIAWQMTYGIGAVYS